MTKSLNIHIHVETTKVLTRYTVHSSITSLNDFVSYTFTHIRVTDNSTDNKACIPHENQYHRIYWMQPLHSRIFFPHHHFGSRRYNHCLCTVAQWFYWFPLSPLPVLPRAHEIDPTAPCICLYIGPIIRWVWTRKRTIQFMLYEVSDRKWWFSDADWNYHLITIKRYESVFKCKPPDGGTYKVMWILNSNCDTKIKFIVSIHVPTVQCYLYSILKLYGKVIKFITEIYANK